MNDETDDSGTITIDTMAYSSLSTSLTGAASTYFPNSTSFSISGGGTGATAHNYTTMAPNYSSGIICEGDANFKGDVKVKGKSIVDSLEAIEKRLSILTPDPKKLAKYEALQKAYAHYKTIEAMCHDDDD
jgi:hypothetical protein